MKKYVLSAALIAAVAVGCKDEKKETEVAVDTREQVDVTTVAANSGDGISTELVETDVPDSIRTSFVAKYPKAAKAKWMKYEPVETDTAVNLQFAQNYYYVTYYADGADYTSWYDNTGNWVKTSTSVSGPSELPDAVNKTINMQYPDYNIEKIEKEEDDGIVEYEVKLKKGEQKVKLKLLENGEISKRKVK